MGIVLYCIIAVIAFFSMCYYINHDMGNGEAKDCIGDILLWSILWPGLVVMYIFYYIKIRVNEAINSMKKKGKVNGSNCK